MYWSYNHQKGKLTSHNERNKAIKAIQPITPPPVDKKTAKTKRTISEVIEKKKYKLLKNSGSAQVTIFPRLMQLLGLKIGDYLEWEVDPLTNKVNVNFYPSVEEEENQLTVPPKQLREIEKIMLYVCQLCSKNCENITKNRLSRIMTLINLHDSLTNDLSLNGRRPITCLFLTDKGSFYSIRTFQQYFKTLLDHNLISVNGEQKKITILTSESYPLRNHNMGRVRALVEEYRYNKNEVLDEKIENFVAELVNRKSKRLGQIIDWRTKGGQK